MKRDNVNYVLVGGFVLAMGIVLLYALYRISGHSAVGEIYYTHFDNVAGIKRGSLVTFQGYEVGNVDRIEPVRQADRTLYRVALNVRAPMGIAEDSQATITAPGLLAAPLIDIREGQSAQFLKAGGELKGVAGTDLMASIAALSNELRDLTENSLRPMLTKVGQRVDQVSGNIEENLPPTLNDLRRVMARLNETAGRIDTLFDDENRKHVAGMLKHGHDASANVAALVADIQATSSEFEGLLKDSRHFIKDSGGDVQSTLKRADALLYQLESAGRHLNEFSRSIRENPAALLQSKPPVDAAGERP